MRFTIAAAVMLAAAALPLAAADLDEARRLLRADRPEAALEITTAALSADPHDPTAHALHLSALHARGRTREAVPSLDAWAAQAPWDPRPLRILVAAYALLSDGAGLASIPVRAGEVPEEPRRDLLRAVASTQLAASLWSDAADTLAATPAATGDAREDRLFAALDAARLGNEDGLHEILSANPDLYDFDDGEAVWWMQKLLDRAPPPADVSAEPDTEDAGANDEPRFPSADDVLPVALRKVEPVYPDVARRAKIEGKVTVQAVILTSGRTASPRVVASSNPMFDDAARRAILRWRYTPAMRAGRPVAIYFTILVHFRLRPGEH